MVKGESPQVLAKKAAAAIAVSFVEAGMVVGLGTGSTALHFITGLGERCRDGLKISAVASSQASFDLAQREGIPVCGIDMVTQIDFTADGADEIDPQKRMTKGGGGALVRERILASASREMVVIVDSSKCVKKLGAFPLAVEVVPFGHQLTLRHLEQKGYKGVLRYRDKEPYVTDNGLYIIDIHFNVLRDDPERDHAVIKQIAGVVDTGFFCGLAGRVVVGYPDGKTEILE